MWRSHPHNFLIAKPLVWLLTLPDFNIIYLNKKKLFNYRNLKIILKHFQKTLIFTLYTNASPFSICSICRIISNCFTRCLTPMSITSSSVRLPNSWHINGLKTKKKTCYLFKLQDALLPNNKKKELLEIVGKKK